MNSKVFTVLFIFLLIAFMGTQFTLAQNNGNQTALSASNNDSLKSSEPPANITQVKNYWQLTELGGGFRWFIFGTLIIGLLIVLYEVIIILQDRINARSLLSVNLKNMQLAEIKAVLENKRKSFLLKISQKIIEYYERTGDANGILDEISTTVAQKEKNFNTFTKAISFLSDTAGALGLLGTVWGMFQTFFSPQWDTQTILKGMGIALITTLLGLIVSIILNLAGTVVFKMFNTNVTKTTEKVDEVKLVLLSMNEPDQSIKDKKIAITPSGKPESHKNTGNDKEIQKSDEKGKDNVKLILESPAKMNGIVAKKLNKPIRVKLTSSEKILPGKAVKFEITSGPATFKDGNKAIDVITDKHGRAEANFVLSEKVDNYLVSCKVEDSVNSAIDISINALPDKPAELQELHKTFSVSLNQELESPVKVQLFDKWRNPVENYKIIFETDGGSFTRSGHIRNEVLTDQEGYATTSFFAGSTPAVYKITATPDGYKDQKIELSVVSIG